MLNSTNIAQSVMDTDHGIFNSMIGQGWTLVAFAGDWGATSGPARLVRSKTRVTYPGLGPRHGFRRRLFPRVVHRPDIHQ